MNSPSFFGFLNYNTDRKGSKEGGKYQEQIFSSPMPDAPPSDRAVEAAHKKFPLLLPRSRQLPPAFGLHLREDKPPRFHVRKKVDA